MDRLRLVRRAARAPGLAIDPRASSNLALAHFELGAGARVRIAAGVVTERRPGALRILVGDGGRLDVGEGVWLRTDLGPVVLAVFPGARMDIGPESFLNGCHLSAKCALTLGRRVFVGPGSRIFDADQHDLDATHPERCEPVQIGPHTWIASDVTVLRGVKIGAHAVVGSRSLVTADVAPHTVAFGLPARAHGSVGDRSRTR